MKPRNELRASTTIRDRVAKALDGRCYDCRGQGQRSNLQGRTVSCVTCRGTGRLAGYSTGALANVAGVSVANTYDALLDILDSGRVERFEDSGVELWQAAARKAAV